MTLRFLIIAFHFTRLAKYMLSCWRRLTKINSVVKLNCKVIISHSRSSHLNSIGYLLLFVRLKWPCCYAVCCRVRSQCSELFICKTWKNPTHKTMGKITDPSNFLLSTSEVKPNQYRTIDFSREEADASQWTKGKLTVRSTHVMNNYWAIISR